MDTNAVIKRIEMRIAQLQMSKEEFYQKAGISSASYSQWNTGKITPSKRKIAQAAEALGVTLEYLLGEDAPWVDISARFNALDEHGKTVVEMVLSEEERRLSEQVSMKFIPLLSTSFAAGTGEPESQVSMEEYQVPSDSRADFAIRVTGDSMSPYLENGAIALGIKKQPQDGDVGAFMLDGGFYVKQFIKEAHGIVLRSLNRKRADMDVSISDDVSRNLICYGTILIPKIK